MVTQEYQGKEYIVSLLRFEGEFLNDMKNGEGKEYYDDGSVAFEGEYLYNDKRKGKFYIEKSLEYEGEYLFDKKWNGKGYDKEGNVIYELNNGNGKVMEYNDDGEILFEGEYLNGKKIGKGKEYVYGRLIFEGEFLNGKRHGKGKDYNFGGDVIFEGEYLNGKRNDNDCEDDD